MSRRGEDERDTANVVPLHGPAQTGSTVVGWLVAWDRDEGMRVDWPGNPHGPVIARSMVAFDSESSREAIDNRRGLVLTFECCDERLPIVLGQLVEGPSVEAELPPQEVPITEIDGKRVHLEGADEIVLQCGKAKIVLRRNGRVIIRGTYVETRSAGTNRIKGGAVLIN